MTATNPLSYLGEQLEAWRQAGTYQRLRVLESPCEPVSRVDGREVINLASNNYLGLPLRRPGNTARARVRCGLYRAP
jgi:glycine C-acetyltransferase